MEKEKIYKVTYKVFAHERIKKVLFHGKMLYPLYIQLIFDRKNTVYKCNLFDLYSKPKFGIRVAGELFAPPIDEVVRREEQLAEFIINKHPEDFSFEVFKKEYDYYSRDLLDEMEPDFQLYLHTFFQDEGMPHLADHLNIGLPPCHLAEVVKDLKRSLKPELYNRLIEHSFLFAPPYLPLFQFAEPSQGLRRPYTSILFMDWEKPETQSQFEEIVKKYYPDKNLTEVLDGVKKYFRANP